VSRKTEGRLVTAPRLLISGSKVRVLDGPPIKTRGSGLLGPLGCFHDRLHPDSCSGTSHVSTLWHRRAELGSLEEKERQQRVCGHGRRRPCGRSFLPGLLFPTVSPRHPERQEPCRSFPGLFRLQFFGTRRAMVCMGSTTAGLPASRPRNHEPVTCRLCGKPIHEGEARYREPGGDVHVDCRDKERRRGAG
jgi:hypothetical protein